MRYLALAALIALLCVLVGCGSTVPGPTPELGADSPAAVRTFYGVADTYLWQAQPNSNYSWSLKLHCGSNPRGKALRTLVRFNLTKVPATARVTRATLTLFVSQVNRTASTYEVHAVTKAWTESGATWTRNASSYDPKVVAKQAIAPALVGKFVSFDVTSLAQTWVSSPSKNLGCLLRGVEGNSATEVVFNSRRQFTPSRRPRLELTYSR